MRAHDETFIDFLNASEKVFSIPVYQRNYSWDQEQCEQLFLDIETIARTGNPHFIGSIVYVKIGATTGPEISIIDGQQRVTSLLLFLRAAYDLSEDPTDRRMIRHLFVNVDYDQQARVKLKQIESDSSVFEKLMIYDEFQKDAFDQDEKNTRLYQNYSYFKSAINKSKYSPKELSDAADKLEIINVKLEQKEDPQAVFESMNSTGKTLTNGDLVRNYLLMDIDHAEQERIYKKYWNAIERAIGSDNTEDFIICYFITKRKSDGYTNPKTKKINRRTLYEFCKWYYPPDQRCLEKTEELLKDMYLYAIKYKNIIRPDLSTKFGQRIHELIFDLGAEPAAIFILYLMMIQHKESITEQEMADAVSACISYVFRVKILKGSVSNQFFSLAIQAYENSDENLPFMERVWIALHSGQGGYHCPDDHEFRASLENANIYFTFKQPLIRYMLYKYEAARTKELVESTDASIEHILPQSPNQWKEYLLSKGDVDYPEHINKLGNLILMHKSYNTTMSNKPFKTKCNEFYSKSGYQMPREIIQYPSWTSKEIDQRTKDMAQEALTLWPIQKPSPERRETQGKPRLVDPNRNAYILNFQAPSCYEELCDAFERDETNFEALFRGIEEGGTSWSVAADAEPGDTVFFMMASTAIQRLRRSCTEAREMEDEEILEYGEKEKEVFKKYSGYMLMRGIIVSYPEEDEYNGHKTYFADIENLEPIEPPLHISVYKEYSKLNSFGSVTKLTLDAWKHLENDLYNSASGNSTHSSE